MNQKPEKSVLISDLDNTLWDWLSIWHAWFMPRFNAICEAYSEKSEEEIIAVVKTIHEKAGTSEYEALFHEVEGFFGNSTDSGAIREKYKNAYAESASQQAQAIKLYADVADTLAELKQRGTKIIGFTESLAYSTVQRVKAVNLDGVFDKLYSPEDHSLPDGFNITEMRTRNSQAYELLDTKHIKFPRSETKPNPELLLRIIKENNAIPSQCVYVGDKEIKDVLMAQEAGVSDVQAKYGESMERSEYEFLRRVTHWSMDAVEKEKTLPKNSINPSIVIEKSFRELIDHFDFKCF